MRRILCVCLVAMCGVALLGNAAHAAEEKTVLNYSIKEARASLWQIHYPGSTFISEFYSPCTPEDTPYACDRNDYNRTPGTCPEDVALGRTKEAPETPKSEDLGPEAVTDDGGTGPAAEWPRGNPVAVVHSLASARLSSTPESGGFASMYYVDNSGRRETEAHVESDAYTGNRASYEERCAVVDAFSEDIYPGPFQGAAGPFHAHMLSRADEKPSVYSMSSFTTAEAPAPPGQSKEGVSIVKLWEADGRVHGLLTSTIRGASFGDLTVDAVRSVIAFSSDGTEKGLVAEAKTEALGINLMGQTFSLAQGQVIPLNADTFLGVIRPIVQVSDKGRQIYIRAPGVFLAAKTMLNEICIPEDPFNGDPFQSLCAPVDPLNGQNPFPEPLAGNFTLGGKLFPDQVVYLAGAILDAGVGRSPASPFLPEFPTIPLPPIPPLIQQPLAPPTFTPPGQSPTQPVALPRFEVRELAGSPWPLIMIFLFTAFGLLAIFGRWSTRWALFRKLSRYPPFPAVGWAYRAFLKG